MFAFGGEELNPEGGRSQFKVKQLEGQTSVYPVRIKKNVQYIIGVWY